MLKAAKAFCALFSLWTLGSASLYAANPSQGFVRREGTRLAIDGQSFYFAGANQYYLFYKSRKMIDEVLEDAAHMGLTVMRTWAFCDGEYNDGFCFQPKPRVYDENTFRNLDYAIHKASTLGIRLILTFVNNWDAFGGMNAYVRWSPTARTHDDFYSDPETKAIYRDYLNYVLWRTNHITGVRYKDDPTIMMWELANEPRIERSRAHQLYAWIDEMAGYIKSIDSNHLVTTGSEGDEATDLVATHSSRHIDIASFHLYPEDWGYDDSRTINYIQRQTQNARQKLGKPIFCGEMGRRDRGTRDGKYQAWYNEFARLAVDGANFWLLSGHQDDGSLYPDYDGFTVYYPENASTVAVIENFAKGQQRKNARMLDLIRPEVKAEGFAQAVSGVIRLRGRASDNEQLAGVSLNFGGGYRPASGLANWTFEWDTTTVLDGLYAVEIRATDAEGNHGTETIELEVRNGSAQGGDWNITAAKVQDDGFNFVYDVTAANQTNHPIVGHFVFRYFLTIDGPLVLGSHYEGSAEYQGDPRVNAPHAYYDDVSYIDIDLGERRVEPGAFIGYKGQLSQADGFLKSYNDWSGGVIPAQRGRVERVQLLKDGKPVSGFAP
jgi:mannan endo-1,4-beta-mannosidase